MTCAKPLAAATLADYWCAILSAAESDAVEAHAFGCDDCALRWAALGELASALRDVIGRPGGVTIAASSTTIDRLAALGRTLRTYRAGPGDVVPCTVGANDDVLITWLAGDVAGADRFDVVVESGGRVLARFSDVALDQRTGQLAFLLAADLARTFPSMTIRDSLVAIAADGTQRTLAEYTFEHTAFSG